MRFRPQELNGFDPQGGPPFGFDGVGMRLLLFRGEAGQLHELCEEFLTSVVQQFGQSYSWEPIVSGGHGLVMISIVTYDRMYSGPNPDLGFTSQEECVFSVPVVKRNSVGLPVDIAFFAPYCFVTDDWSIITGRGVLGYPKCEGWFELPGIRPHQDPPYPSPGDAAHYPIRVRARALTQLTHTALANPEPVLHIPDQPEADYPPFGLGSEPQTAWPFGPVAPPLFGPEGEFPVEDGIYALLEKWAGVGAPQLALKQFRDVDSTESACYQALVDFHVNFKRFRDAGLYPLTEARLHDYPSLSIAKRLGLARNPMPDADNIYRVKPFFAYWYYGDFTLHDDDARALGGCGTLKFDPPPGCEELVRQATGAVGSLAKAQLEQWRRAAEMTLSGRYGAAEYRAHLREAFERTVGCGRDLTDIYWRSLGHLTK